MDIANSKRNISNYIAMSVRICNWNLKQTNAVIIRNDTQILQFLYGNTMRLISCYTVEMGRFCDRFCPLNRRMPKCNSALQTERDIFRPEIRPNLPENCQISAFF